MRLLLALILLLAANPAAAQWRPTTHECETYADIQVIAGRVGVEVIADVHGAVARGLAARMKYPPTLPYDEIVVVGVRDQRGILVLTLLGDCMQEASVFPAATPEAVEAILRQVEPET